jgi:hypothetical protein
MAKAKKEQQAPFEEGLIETKKQVPTFEQIVTSELTKFDAVTPKIEELSAQFLPLRIANIEDKDGYEEVKKALKVMIGTRTAVEDKRKELKADSLAFGRAVDSRAKEITSMLFPIEYHLSCEKEKIDNEIEAIAQKAEAELQMILTNKHNRLIEAGMILVGNEYIFKISHFSDSFPRINIETLNEDEFDNYVYTISDLNQKEIQRIKNENEQREAEARKLSEEAEKLVAQKAEIENEMKALTQERLDARIVVLESLGLIVSQISPFIFYKSKSLVTRDELRSLNISDWAVKLASIKQVIIDIDKFTAEQEDFAKKEAEIKVKAELIDAQNAEIERVSNLDDKDKYLDYISKINAIPKPELKTAKWKKILLNSIIIPDV